MNVNEEEKLEFEEPNSPCFGKQSEMNIGEERIVAFEESDSEEEGLVEGFSGFGLSEGMQDDSGGKYQSNIDEELVSFEKFPYKNKVHIPVHSNHFTFQNYKSKPILTSSSLIQIPPIKRPSLSQKIPSPKPINTSNPFISLDKFLNKITEIPQEKGIENDQTPPDFS